MQQIDIRINKLEEYIENNEINNTPEIEKLKKRIEFLEDIIENKLGYYIPRK